jgi:iron complex transport system ATP-binding protein
VLGVVGPNGAGKSTLLTILGKLLPLEIGNVIFNSKSQNDFSLAEWAKSVTYVGADCISDFPITAHDVVSLGASLHFQSQKEINAIAEKVMQELDCWHYRDRLLSKLSSGERQRVAIARARAQQAKVLLLDESLSRLDLHHQAQMGLLFKKWASQGLSIVLVSHDLNFTVDWSDRCLLLKEGKKLVEGPTKEVIIAEWIQKMYPQTEFYFSSHPKKGTSKIYF